VAKRSLFARFGPTICVVALCALRTQESSIEDEAQVGTVAVKRYSSNEMQFLINFTGQDAQAIALRGRTLQIYWKSSKLLPRLKTTTGSF
jgi:hypothetical protein